jgi:putative endonuclease
MPDEPTPDPTSTTDPARAPDPRRALGALGEDLACAHLRRRGYEIVDRNFRTRWGELDIVASDGRSLVFCEVKCRRASRSWRDPLESVHTNKQVRLRRMAGQWLAEHRDRPRRAELRFDAIGVTVDAEGRLLRLDHLEAAF